MVRSVESREKQRQSSTVPCIPDNVGALPPDEEGGGRYHRLKAAQETERKLKQRRRKASFAPRRLPIRPASEAGLKGLSWHTSCPVAGSGRAGDDVVQISSEGTTT